jgi:hypothetical protein
MRTPLVHDAIQHEVDDAVPFKPEDLLKTVKKYI